MAGLTFIQSGDAKGTRVSIDIPKGRYAFLKLALSGTSDTGQTLTLADLGDYRLTRRGAQKQGSDMRFLSQYADLKGGHPYLVAPTAGATRVALFIPFAIPGNPNTMDVADKEELDLTLDFDSGLSTIFGANAFTYELSGYEAPDIPESYELKIVQQDLTASGAGRENDVLNDPNIAAIYIRDDNTVVDQIQLIVDGETIVDNFDDESIRDITNVVNQIESANDITEINMVATGNILEAINSSAKLEARFTGSGTLPVRYFAINFDSEGIERSTEDARRRANQKRAKIQRKAAMEGVAPGTVRNPNR